MIVQCCMCKVVEGVKCPQCGTFMPETAMPQPLEVYMDNRFVCTNLDCNYPFYGREGSISHGYCKPCFKSEMAKIPSKQPAFALYQQ